MARSRRSRARHRVPIDPAGTVVFDGFHVDRVKMIEFLEERVA